MNWIEWNIRGINTPHKQIVVNKCIKRNFVDVCALMEIRVKAKNFAKVSHNTFPRWENINNYYHDVNGKIWLAWNPLIFQGKQISSSY